MAEEAIYENRDPIKIMHHSQADYSGKEENAYNNVSLSGRPSQSYRWVSVCLGLLCVLLLALNIGLGVKYNEEKDHLQAEREHLLASYVNVTMERDQVSAIYTNLTRQMEELRVTNSQLQARISKLEKRCPSGWRYFNTKCYLISSSGKTWSESRQHCKDSGGDLVIINNKEEQVFTHGLGISVWIGLRKNMGVWKWVDNTQLSTKYWRTGQPNYANEDCVLIEVAGDPLRSWHNYPCNHNADFICEIPAY